MYSSTLYVGFIEARRQLHPMVSREYPEMQYLSKHRRIRQKRQQGV